jgi:ethanolamine utilization protein EutN
MFLARIDGTMTSTVKHPSLEGARLLIGQRLDVQRNVTGEPFVVLDTLGASKGAVVLVSTDGDIQRKLRGNNCPARFTVVGLVDFVAGVPV